MSKLLLRRQQKRSYAAAAPAETIMYRLAYGGVNGFAGISATCTIATGAADPDGGSNAIQITDSGDAVNGAVRIDASPITFYMGVNRFRAKMKVDVSVAAKMWARLIPINTTILSNAHFNLSDGAVGTESWIGTPTITALGGGWFEIDGTLDMTGADVAGGFSIQLGDINNDTTVVRSGNKFSLYDFRVSHT